MEMGTSGLNVAAETPIPETPPNGPAGGCQGSSLGSQSYGGFGAQNLSGGVPNLAASGLVNAPCLAGVPTLGGYPSFQNLPGPQQCFGPPGFVGTQIGNGQGMLQQNMFQHNASGCSSGGCGSQPFVLGRSLIGAPSPQNGEGICQGSRGQMPPGGMTPQASVIRQVADLVGQLDPNQTRELQVILQERMSSQARMVPEYFGEFPRPQSGVGFFGDGPTLPVPNYAGGCGEGQDSWSSGRPMDVFAKTEKWLTPAPVPDTSKWTSRESEIMGFSEYLSMLTSWAAQASLEFAQEIEQSSRWNGVLHWDVSGPAKNRSTRLLAILRNAFVGHARTSMLINAFLEGVSLDSHTGTLDLNVARNQVSNGYELLRQMTVEYSLQSRSEALALRTALVNRTFNVKSSEAGSSQVADVIRRIDYEAARFSRLLGTLPPSVDATGLGMPEADLLLLLLKNLPEQVRSFVLHHASGESYMAYRSAARNYEERQRLFGDPKFGKQVNQIFGQANPQQVEETPWNEHDGLETGINAVGQEGKCSKCGSRKHTSQECTTDLAKVRCFKCNAYGHIGANCSQGKKQNSFGSTGFGKGKGSDKGSSGGDKGKGKGNKGKGKGKPKGFGKKGKLNEMYDDGSSWDWSEWDWSQEGWVSEVGWSDQSWSDAAWYGDSWNGEGWDQSWDSGPQGSDSHQHEETEAGQVGSLIISMMTCLDGFEEETGLFFEDGETDLCFREKTFLEDGSDVFDGKRRILDVDQGSLFDVARGSSWSSCCPQPLFESDVCDSTRFSNMLVESQVSVVSNMSMCDAVGVSCFGFEEGKEHWTAWDALLPQVAAEVRSGAGQVVPSQVEAVLFASAAELGDCRRTRFDGLTGCVPDQGGFGDFGLRGEVLEGETDSLVSTFRGKVTCFVLPRSSRENRNPCHRLLVQDTISPKFQIFRFRETLFPLLSQLSESDSSWWLLDSGASTTVLSEKFAHEYGVDVSKMFSKDSPYRAANGTPVKMLGKAEVGVGVVMVDEWGESRVKRHAKLRAMIGNIQHNIISTTSLCKTGWQFWQGEDWCELINTVSGEKATEVGFFAGCPWVKKAPC